MDNTQSENLTRLLRMGKGSPRFVNNRIKTSNYNWYSFLPLSLMRQMQSSSNIYFFIVGLLQMIKSISPTNQYPLIFIPLGSVLLLNSLRDYIEERKRVKKDWEINSRQVRRVVDRQSVNEVDQESLRVGELVKIVDGETIPADMVILESSEKGCCYIETKDLDGETYFKRKEIPRQYYENNYDYVELMRKQALFECEEPTKHMYHFSGLLTHSRKVIPYSNDNFLLSGSSLKNTQWIVGMVVYTG